MKKSVKKELEKLIEERPYYDCSIEEFINKEEYEYQWWNISLLEKLSEDFIREFKDKLDWYYLSQKQEFSENFIREFKDKVDWSFIYKYQELSDYFVYKFQDRVGKDSLKIHNKNMYYRLIELDEIYTRFELLDIRD